MTKDKDKTESKYTITFAADDPFNDEQRKGIEAALAGCKVEINKILLP